MALDPNVTHLMARESHWDTASVWLAVAVAVGVACEAVTEFDGFAEWLQLDTLERHALRKDIAKGGLLILIVALTLEVVAAIATHRISQNITADLTQQIAVDQDRENALIDTTDALRHQGVIQAGALSTLTGRANQFQAAADAQRARIDHAMTIFNESERRLNRAQTDATASAAKAASASALADSTAAQMKNTLADEQQFDREMRKQLTHRVLTEDQIFTISNDLRTYSGAAYDVSTAQDPDSVNLAWQLAQMLADAGWDWRTTSGFLGLSKGTLPKIGQYFGEGLHLAVCKSDVTAFEPIAGALQASLMRAGLSMTGENIDDKQAPTQGITCKILHIQIGAR